MKKIFLPYVIFGVAAGILTWTCQEFLFVLVEDGFIPRNFQSAFAGILLGGIAGAILGRLEGFMVYNHSLTQRGTVMGGSLGAISGLLSFYMVDYIQQHFPDIVSSNVYYLKLLFASRWFIIAVFIGISIGIRNRSNLYIVRGILSGIIGGVITSVFSLVLFSQIQNPFWARAICITSFTTILTISLLLTSRIRRKGWITSLNGKFEGIEFELDRDIHFLGSQVDDDINLSSYQNVNRTHAKLLKYYTGYSLVDNDPFGQTFVNFRSINEQSLKTGDIIKVGDAIFQYCQKAG